MPLGSSFFAKDNANDIAVFETAQINNQTKRSDLHKSVRGKNNKFPAPPVVNDKITCTL